MSAKPAKQQWPQWLPEWSARLPRPLRAMVRYWINLQDRLEYHAAERRWERARRNAR